MLTFVAFLPVLTFVAFLPMLSFVAFLPKLPFVAFLPMSTFVAFLPISTSVDFLPMLTFVAFLPIVNLDDLYWYHCNQSPLSWQSKATQSSIRSNYVASNPCLFLKPPMLAILSISYLIWLESSFQALSISTCTTTYMFLECI